MLGLDYGDAADLGVTVVVLTRGLIHPAFRNAVCGGTPFNDRPNNLS